MLSFRHSAEAWHSLQAANTRPQQHHRYVPLQGGLGPLLDLKLCCIRTSAIEAAAWIPWQGTAKHYMNPEGAPLPSPLLMQGSCRKSGQSGDVFDPHACHGSALHTIDFQIGFGRSTLTVTTSRPTKPSTR